MFSKRFSWRRIADDEYEYCLGSEERRKYVRRFRSYYAYPGSKIKFSYEAT